MKHLKSSQINTIKDLNGKSHRVKVLNAGHDTNRHLTAFRRGFRAWIQSGTKSETYDTRELYPQICTHV